MPVAVLVEATLKPGAAGEMKALLKKLLPETRAFDGFVHIDVYHDLDNPHALTLYERWASRAHYEAYLAWRTENGTLDQLGALLAAPPRIRFFERWDV